MAKQTINLGTMADNKSGDPLRTAFTKINQNFDELYPKTGTNTYVDTTIVLDVTKTVNKITPVAGSTAANYHLPDGTDGQVMHIVPTTGGEVNSQYTTMSFDNARWSNGNGIINEASSVTWWLPFRSSSNTPSTVLTLVFSDGHWNLPHNYFD